MGINDSGSFLWDGSGFSMLDSVPGYPGWETQFQGINNSGTIVGNYYLPSWTGVIRQSDGTLFYPVPHPYMGYGYGNLESINDYGVVVGEYSDGSSYHGYTYDPRTGQDTLLADYPGSFWTWPLGINNDGTIVGYYQNADGSYFAYESTPEPSGLLLMTGGVLMLLIRKRRRPMA